LFSLHDISAILKTSISPCMTLVQYWKHRMTSRAWCSFWHLGLIKKSQFLSAIMNLWIVVWSHVISYQVTTTTCMMKASHHVTKASKPLHIYCNIIKLTKVVKYQGDLWSLQTGFAFLKKSEWKTTLIFCLFLCIVWYSKKFNLIS